MLAVNMLPMVELEAAHRVFVVAAAITASVVTAILAVSRPVQAIFEMGRDHGRREARVESAVRSSGESVIPFRQRSRAQ